MTPETFGQLTPGVNPGARAHGGSVAALLRPQAPLRRGQEDPAWVRWTLVALAFECQLFADIPTEAHDIFMDRVITEKEVIVGKGRGR